MQIVMPSATAAKIAAPRESGLEGGEISHPICRVRLGSLRFPISFQAVGVRSWSWLGPGHQHFNGLAGNSAKSERGVSAICPDRRRGAHIREACKATSELPNLL